MKKRRVFRLQWSKQKSQWRLSEKGKSNWVLYGNLPKADTLRYAAGYVRALAPSQLVVHNKDGTFSFERTYGADPARRKG